LKFKNSKIDNIIQKISEKSEFNFVYSVDDLQNIKAINLDVTNVNVEEILDICLAETDMDYQILDEVIIISPKEIIEQVEIDIRGKVTDSDGIPLPGATVIIKGTLKGTTTDVDGVYKIVVSGETTALKFSFVGYEEQIIEVGKKTVINVILKESATSLNEVIITGMFKKKAETYTGSVTTITEKELKMYGNRNIITTLKNIDPAFNIIESNEFGSDPNHLPEINIRGTSSLPSISQLQNDTKANLNTPLIILDGFEISLQKLSTLNDDELKNITLLKDASATAIYGSRGANGVVVITTKEPEQGKLKITYSTNINIEVPDLNGYDLLNAREKLDLELKAGIYNSKGPWTNLALKQKYNAILSLVTKGVNTDWMSKPLRTSIGQRHNLKLEGGDDKFRYSASVNYNLMTGVMKGSNRKTFNGSINLTYYHKKITFRNQLNISLNKSENSPYGNFGDYVKLNPYWAPYNNKGNLVKIFDQSSVLWGYNKKYYPVNPLYNASLHTINSSDYTNITNNFSVEWKVMEGFSLRGKMGISKLISNSDNFKPANHTDFAGYANEDLLRRGKYIYGTGKGFNYDFNITASYSKTVADKHHIYTGFDYGMSEKSNQNYMFAVEGFVHESLDFLSMALQYEQNGNAKGRESTTRRIGLTGNINYSYDNRYFADLSYRIDGSSQFGTNKRFAPFWSAGIGWNIHKEDWFNNTGIVNNLKIKANYGVTGSQQFSAYQAMSIYRYYTDDRYLDWMGARLLGLGNEDLEWQTTNQFNIGFESQLFNKRLRFNVDIYYKTTSNLLSQMDIPLSNGFPSYTENIGEVENKGFELMASAIIITGNKLLWSITGKLSHNQNKIIKLSAALKKQNEKIQNMGGSSPNRLIFEGDPVNAIYVVPSLGIDPSTGKELFLKKDGEITYTWDANDRVFAGISSPKFRGNFSSFLHYGNFEMNMSFGFYWGGQVYNQTLIDRVENADLKYNVDRRVYEDRWMKAGDKTFYKGINETDASQYSSRFVQNEAILKLQNVNLSYRLENDWFKNHMGLQSLRFTCNMGNLFYLSTVKRERGLYYPFSRSVSFSILAIF
jgi:TonB-linked SusC/RagA family outer membrane protein